MATPQDRAALDELVRRLMRETDPAARSARLTAALSAGWDAADSGLGVDAALAELQAAADEVPPASVAEDTPAAEVSDFGALASGDAEPVE